MNLKYLILLIIALITFKGQGQDYYFITAKSGLNVRAEANISSRKIGEIRFGAWVEKIEESERVVTILDNGKEMNGKFVKIKYDASYLSEESIEGFVFDGYLKKQVVNRLIDINKITKETYTQLERLAPLEGYSPKKITDINTINSILKGRLEWYDENYIKCITLTNGQKLLFKKDAVDFGFSEGQSGYYPKEEILVLEGGHGTDVCFSLQTGETTESIGNPEYIISSPKNTYRLNGYFGGQECVSYFFQKKENGTFEYFTAINYDYDICNFKTFQWISENEFIYTIPNYSKDLEKEILKYFKGKLNQ